MDALNLDIGQVLDPASLRLNKDYLTDVIDKTKVDCVRTNGPVGVPALSRPAAFREVRPIAVE